MGRPRNTSKYLVKRGNKIIHGGITDDLERRTQEWLRIYPDARVVKVGRRTTREAALAWERKHGYGANQS